ncbi:hypothetical protein CDD81_3080 [Ophiocordyceps australis]|uniref:N-acetyltransferase domain-containing protein n=1 Tax=Ophiocordyceps australis TaxID=1399860 RepID=A0A2C5YEB7_9HYPO|nr:hypothetical protein CDD81_3080 [Ophiocordyceps australis]
MSLPTSKASASQLSIRSFFQSKGTPNYVSPPAALPASNDTPAGSNAHDEKSSLSGASSGSPRSQKVDAPFPPWPTNLPPQAAIRPVTTADIVALRRINTLLLPVSYPDTFYQLVVDPESPSRFSRVITWAANDGDEPKVVGAVVSRVQPSPRAQNHDDLYIQSLCLLSPYRGLGLVAAALQHIVATAVADPGCHVRLITAHVWTENDQGLRWYDGRGFRRREPPVQDYYRKLRPGSAWLVERDVDTPIRGSQSSSSIAPPPSRSIAPSPTAAVVNLGAPAPPSSTPSCPSQEGTSSTASFKFPGDPRAGTETSPPIVPPAPSRGQSYQSQRPETDWNDLPADMAPNLLLSSRSNRKEPNSGTSSRSSSAARKKRDRTYPAAAFGS